jgi:hypothetical protein
LIINVKSALFFVKIIGTTFIGQPSRQQTSEIISFACEYFSGARKIFGRAAAFLLGEPISVKQHVQESVEQATLTAFYLKKWGESTVRRATPGFLAISIPNKRVMIKSG